MKHAWPLMGIGVLNFLLGSIPVAALNPSLDVSQYAHTTWTLRDEFSLGTIFAFAQTPDGYLWLGSEFGLFRFDGVRFVQWQPPAGQLLPSKPYSLLVTHDGTLWIGTYYGLATWNGSKLTEYPEVHGSFVTSLLEDQDGTVWVGTLGGLLGTPTGRLCAIRSGRANCYGEDGAFGTFVWSLAEDSSGNLWAGADSSVWRWKPGSPKRYSIAGMRVGDLTRSEDGKLLIGISGGGLKQIVDDKIEPYPIHSVNSRKALLPERDVDSNKLLRDRDGGLWIGTHERGLIHIHRGRTDVFTKSDGLSGNIIAGVFEDHEGTIWVSTNEGLDRFRELTATTISARQGLSSDNALSVLASADGSVWIAGRAGLTRWRNGETTIFRKASGLPDDVVESLFEDHQRRIWVFTRRGVAYFKDGRFVRASIPSEEVFSITGDKAGNLWLSGNRGLSHLRDLRLVEHVSWSALGRREQAKALVFDPEHGGVWLSFGIDGGVLYFKDGRVRASYTAADGLGKGHVPDLRLDGEGALWAATAEGGLSRIKGGGITTLTTRNGLPCDGTHWSIEDDDHSLWVYTACGLVRIERRELDAWVADSKRRIEFTLWDAADGITLRSGTFSYYPVVAKSRDDKLWFMTGEGVQVVDPHYLPFNNVPPPVHIEGIIADRKTYWQNLQGVAVSNLRLPPKTRDLQINYTALSLAAPEKVHFKYKLDGQDTDWREVVNKREVQYSNLAPGPYAFRVIASNNSGVWNKQGDVLEFSVAPAYYQTNWFRALCAAVLLALFWALYEMRLHQVSRQFEMKLEARVSERTRIARELHDTLLQSLHGLMFQFQAARNLMTKRPDDAMRSLDDAIKETEHAISESRDAIHGLRSEPIAACNLTDLLVATSKQLASVAAQELPVFKLIEEGERRTLSAAAQAEVCRIALEMLRNAYRHAGAHQIEAEIRYGAEMFRLRIRDDGRGIDPEVLKQGGGVGHWGLRGMRERAERIGAQLEFWSEVGAGTEVQLAVPAAVAYETARYASGFKLFKRSTKHEQRV